MVEFRVSLSHVARLNKLPADAIDGRYGTDIPKQPSLVLAEIAKIEEKRVWCPWALWMRVHFFLSAYFRLLGISIPECTENNSHVLQKYQLAMSQLKYGWSILLFSITRRFNLTVYNFSHCELTNQQTIHN